jgi:hypothetical protein
MLRNCGITSVIRLPQSEIFHEDESKLLTHGGMKTAKTEKMVVAYGTCPQWKLTFSVISNKNRKRKTIREINIFLHMVHQFHKNKKSEDRIKKTDI